MIIGIDKILEHFEIQQKKYFAVFYRNKMQNSIYRNCKLDLEKSLAKEEKLEAKKQHDESYTYQQAKESFEKYIHILGPGEYTLVVSDNLDVTQRGNSTVDFKIPVGETSSTAHTNNNYVAGHGNSITKEEAERIADERFEKLMIKNENATLKEKLTTAEKEVKELQAKVSGPWSDAVAALAPHTSTIIAGLFGTAANVPQLTISGATPTSIGAGDEAEQQKIFENFVSAISISRPNDWLQIIERLTVLVADTAKLEMALKFI